MSEAICREQIEGKSEKNKKNGFRRFLIMEYFLYKKGLGLFMNKARKKAWLVFGRTDFAPIVLLLLVGSVVSLGRELPPEYQGLYFRLPASWPEISLKSDFTWYMLFANRDTKGANFSILSFGHFGQERLFHTPYFLRIIFLCGLK